MTGVPINEPLEVRLDEPTGALEALASGTPPAEVAARHPDCLAAWAALGDAALEGGRAVDAYAYYRVGYHRGLDRLRGSGWRGSGRVPWSHEPNRGFLSSLAGLGRAAGALGESAEERRCAEFLERLAPDYPS